MILQDELAPLFALEQEIVEASKGFQILSVLQWPSHVLESFLATWRTGNPQIPEVSYEIPEGLDALCATMESVMQRAPLEHPLGDLLYKTAWSYSTAARMLQAVGTPDFSERSIELYGKPNEKRPRQDWSDAEAAEFLLEKSADLLQHASVPDTDADIDAHTLATKLRARIDPIFVEDPIEVEVAPELASKAAAGSKRVRLRADARFSELDCDQLFQHEVMVHSATMLNGRHQPHLDILGLGSPRTTRTQEGLATLAEIMTGSMDLVRLRRIALRVRAVTMALEGADFIDVFRMFLEEGQSAEESVQSAARVFRGGNPRGGVPFTKDGTYIAGLLEVHTFLRVAVRDGRPDLIPLLFAGRLTLGDVVVIAPLAKAGLVQGPRYIPTWASDLRRLTATLAYGAFQTFIDLERVKLHSAVRHEERRIEGSPAAEAADEA